MTGSRSAAPRPTATARNPDGVPDRVTVLYDARCGVCRLTVRALARLDWRHRLGFVPLQRFVASTSDDPTARALMRSLHVRDGADRWFSGGRAALKVAAAVPMLVPISILGRLPGMRGPVEAAYQLIADNRQAIGRLLRIG